MTEVPNKIVHSEAVFSCCSVYADSKNLRASCWQRQNGRGQLSSKQWRGVTKRHALFFVRRDHDFSSFSHRRAGLVSGGNILFCRLSILPDSDSCLGLLRRVQSLCCSNDRTFWAELPGDDDRLDPLGTVAHYARIYPCLGRNTGPRRVIKCLIPPSEASY
jgi:hypothetical protein